MSRVICGMCRRRREQKYMRSIDPSFLTGFSHNWFCDSNVKFIPNQPQPRCYAEALHKEIKVHEFRLKRLYGLRDNPD